jgi:ubiquinone/menaquinone biosynthesis C-methylase UbiE
MQPMNDNHRYPALMVDRLTPAYDLFASLFMPEKQFKLDLIARAGIAPGQCVLDLGAGTGTLAIMLKQSQPAAQVTGLDGDAGILTIAREKAARAGTAITFDLGQASALPYPDASFDRVLSSLVMSLLSRADKQQAVREAYRVLRGGGELHIGDFGPPHTRWGRLVAPLLRRFDRVADNLHGLLPALFREAGFEHVEEGARFATAFGTLSMVSGRKPGG